MTATSVNTNNHHLTNTGVSPPLSQLFQQFDGISTASTTSYEGSGGVMPSLAATTLGEHYSTKQPVPLGNESDRVRLSDFLVFLRLNCIEVFEASSQLVKERNRYKQIFLHQVGIRCRFCTHLPYSKRGKRSCSFPQTQSRIYQSVTMMIRDHFSVCKEMPKEIREEYDKKKAVTKRGEQEAKQYWIESSEKLGLVDTAFGIFYQEKASKDDFKNMQQKYRKE